MNVIVFWFVNTYRSPLVEVIELVASAACRTIAWLAFVTMPTPSARFALLKVIVCAAPGAKRRELATLAPVMVREAPSL